MCRRPILLSIVHKMYAAGWYYVLLRTYRSVDPSLANGKSKRNEWREKRKKTQSRGHIIPFSYPWNSSQRRRRRRTRRTQFHFIPFLWSVFVWFVCVHVHFGHPIECRMFFVFEIVFRLNTYIIVIILWPNAFRWWPRAGGGDSHHPQVDTSENCAAHNIID